MVDREHQVLTGHLLDDSVKLTITEISCACRVREDDIVELVEEGIIEPLSPDSATWTFPGPQLRRAHKAVRLQRDLEINLAGVALVLDLLEEMEKLRARLDQF